jgi:hypothetical protein
MKFLQNPVAVGVLALLALALIGKNALAPLLKRSSARKVAAAAPANPAPAPAALAQTTPTPIAVAPTPPPAAAPVTITNIEPAQPLEAQKIKTESKNWVDTAVRDPFKTMAQKVNATRNAEHPPASSRLALKGVWMQTGSSIAVVNGRVLAKDDTILDYRIESIEADRIWVQGPNGREAVEFKLALKPANSPNAVSSPAAEIPKTGTTN